MPPCLIVAPESRAAEAPRWHRLKPLRKKRSKNDSAAPASVLMPQAASQQGSMAWDAKICKFEAVKTLCQFICIVAVSTNRRMAFQTLRSLRLSQLARKWPTYSLHLRTERTRSQRTIFCSPAMPAVRRCRRCCHGHVAMRHRNTRLPGAPAEPAWRQRYGL